MSNEEIRLQVSGVSSPAFGGERSNSSKMEQLQKLREAKFEERFEDLENTFKMMNSETNKKLETKISQLAQFLSVKFLQGQGFETLTQYVQKSTSDVDTQMQLNLKETEHNVVLEIQKSFQGKFDLFSQEMNQFRNNLDDIKELEQIIHGLRAKIDEKASYQNLRNLEFQLEDYVKQEQFQQLMKNMSMKADAHDFISITQQLNMMNSQFKQFRDQVESNKTKIMQNEQKQRENYKNLEHKLKEVDENAKKGIHDNGGKLMQTKEELKLFIRKQEERDLQRKKDIENFQTSMEASLIRLKEHQERFATKDQLHQHRVEIFPAIKEQKERMEKFSKDNEQMKEMIRRFDEVLSEKASKMSLHEQYVEIEKYFVKKKYWDNLQEEIQKSVEKQQMAVVHMQEAVASFEQNMSEEISNAVKKNIQKAMASYERVLGQFSKFFDQEELNNVLERKVDVEYVQALQDLKANKIDLESSLNLIQSLHERIKQMSIVQVELAKALLPIKTSSNFQQAEAKNSKITRRDFLYKQAQITSQWIQDFSVRQTYPGEEENIQNQYNKESLCILNNFVQFSDVPVEIRDFEKYHSTSVQEKTKFDVPTGIRKWKLQQSLKNQMINVGSSQALSKNDEAFYSHKSSNVTPTQITNFLKERQKMYPNQKINDYWGVGGASTTH